MRNAEATGIYLVINASRISDATGYQARYACHIHINSFGTVCGMD
jgi:hypothetical protein